jgi:uncharacterized protein YigE (DUF2233 family)
MTVAELIGLLKQLPQDVPVSVNDEGGGNFHDDVEGVFYVPEDKTYGDRACVILAVNVE